MPWPEKQREAIFLSVQRRKGTAAAKRLMHEAGYGGENHEKVKARVIKALHKVNKGK